MDTIAGWAYGVTWGMFPLVVLLGFAAYALFGATAVLVSLKRFIRPLRRIPVRVHRWMAIAALLLATVHLIFGLSVYV